MAVTGETGSPQVAAADAPAGARHVVRFVLVFLATSFALLTAYRYASNTVFMDGYLFQIARHTSAVLSWVGGSSRVEDPAAYRGREAEVRAGLRGVPVEEAEAAPVTPWEVWRYRMVQGRRAADEVERRLARLRGEGGGGGAGAALSASLEANLHRSRARLREDGPRVYYESAVGRDRAFTFRVVADCGAVPSMAVFVAAVLAFPAGWRKRGLGVAAGVPLLYAVNILRLACLGELGSWIGAGPAFDFAHNYVWQGIYVVFVVAVWLLWVEGVVRGKGLWKRRLP